MRVGAILLFLGSPPDSSCSLSLASLFIPATVFAVLRGVSGGVVMGTPTTFPELAAAILGTFPPINVGLVMTPPGAVDAWVMTDDVELDRAGEDGRWFTNEAIGGGEGAVSELAESRCRCWPLGKGEGGAKTEVGVGIGVFWLEVTAVSDASGR